ncbi:MAG: lipopolysaccharide biosynthesis protein [Firmicutes bacterium]|nr:lipopolysaccharide biosynthesis protein [Bacillota bacterium]
MSTLKKSILFSVGEKYIIFAIQFFTSIIVARLLTPVEFGIFSIGSIFLSFSHIFRDIGISNYVIQEQNLSKDRLETAQSLLFATSWTLAIILWSINGYAASYYSEPGVSTVIIILSLNFLILPFGALSSALLRREMRFDCLLKINISAAIVHALASISLCLFGFGFVSLAWAGVLSTITTVIATIYFSDRKISLRPHFIDWRHIIKTGGRFSGASLLWESGISGPELIVGKTMGLESTAFLGRAQGVVGLIYRTIMEGLAPVLMPHFAKSHREQQDIGKKFIKTINNVSALTFPIFSCLFVAMDSVVMFLYGNQWLASIQPARILCMGMLGLSIAVVGGSVVAGLGETKYSLRFQLFGQPAKLLLVLIACFYSLSHVALAMAFGDLLIAVYVIRTLKKLTGFYWKDLALTIISSAYIAACAGVACFLFKTIASEAGDFIVVIGCMASSTLGWILAIYSSKHPLYIEITTIASSIKNR